MNERDLRKMHLLIGITFALFFLLQGGSGLLISIQGLFEHHEHLQASTAILGANHGNADDHHVIGEEAEEHDHDEHGILGEIHHGEARIWHVYRVVVGAALMMQLFTGIAIFIKLKDRRKVTKG